MDHARAFRHPADRDLDPVDVEPHGARLRESIGRADRFGGGASSIGGQTGGRPRDTPAQDVHGQRNADHAGGRDENQPGRKVERVGREARHFGGVGETGLARAGVGVAAVDDDRLRPAGGDRPLRVPDRRGFDAVRREDAGRGRGDLRDEEREVRLVPLDPAVNSGRAKSPGARGVSVRSGDRFDFVQGLGHRGSLLPVNLHG